MKKPTVYVNPVYPQPERQTGTIWEQATKKKRAKYLIYKYLTLFLVPRPGTNHRNHKKIKESIFLIINYLNISYFLYFCHILPIFRYSVHF